MKKCFLVMVVLLAHVWSLPGDKSNSVDGNVQANSKVPRPKSGKCKKCAYGGSFRNFGEYKWFMYRLEHNPEKYNKNVLKPKKVPLGEIFCDVVGGAALVGFLGCSCYKFVECSVKGARVVYNYYSRG